MPATEIPVTVLLPTDEVGGHERMLIEWLARAREFGLRPTIICRANRDLTDIIENAGLPWSADRSMSPERGIPGGARWRSFIRTWRTAAREPADTPVLLAPGAVPLGILQILACALAGRAVACYVPLAHDSATLHESWPGVRDWLAKRLATRVRVWITVSEEQCRRLRDCWQVRAPTVVIPNRLRLLSDSSPRAASATERRARLSVAYIGRFSPIHKGLDWLVSVLEAEPDWARECHFTFQGRGAYQARLEELAHRLGPDRVRILPWGDPSKALATADVLILTSRFEGLPLIAIEAIWAGVPVVASAESGLVDVLHRACIFAFGDASQFATALQRMRDPANRDDAVAYARERLGLLLSEDLFRASIRRLTQELSALRDRGRVG